MTRYNEISKDLHCRHLFMAVYEWIMDHDIWWMDHDILWADHGWVSKMLIYLPRGWKWLRDERVGDARHHLEGFLSHIFKIGHHIA